MYHISITFQHLYGIGSRLSCGPVIEGHPLATAGLLHIFADDAVILSEPQVLALEALLKEVEPLGFLVFLAKTKVQISGGLLGESMTCS